MTKIRNLKRFGHWILEFGIYLLFEYCYLVLKIYINPLLPSFHYILGLPYALPGYDPKACDALLLEKYRLFPDPNIRFLGGS